jgi:LuxR family quorum sensing-dependent transcriptional regulator
MGRATSGTSKRGMNEKIVLEIYAAISRIDEAQTSSDVLQTLCSVLKRYGFRDCLITGLPVPNNENWQRKVLCDGWSREWFSRYGEQGHYLHDPCVAKSRRTLSPFFWSELQHENITPPGQIVMNEAGAFGMKEGICVPIQTRLSGAAVVTAAGENVDLHPDILPVVDALGRKAFNMLRQLQGGQEEDQQPVLTPREREVLQWSAAGKTVDDIAIILGISRYTVETHLRNVRDKLEVSNLVHGVAEALRRHEIQI